MTPAIPPALPGVVVTSSRASGKSAFLSGVTLRPVKLSGGPFRPIGLALGTGPSALEVLVVSHDGEPALPALRSAWKARRDGRATPVLLVALYGDKAALCGPAGDDAPAYLGLDPGQVERICREALDQPDRHAALRALRDSVPAVESDLAGIRNEGFLATHELRVGARARDDWDTARGKALRVVGKRGRDLLSGLGFHIETHDRVVSLLRAGDRKVAVAVLLNRDEAPELQAERFSSLSPITYALAVADRENVPYVVLQHGAKVRIYPSRVGVGVGRRGRTETYVECHAGLLRDADAAYLWLLCSAEALAEGGSLDQLMEESGRFSGDLAERLRERIYESVIPRLAEGIVAARGLKKATAQDLADTYEMTMTVLFRLLFVAYAEDKNLLPFRWNGLYRRRSLKTKSIELLELARKDAPFDEGDSLWDEVTRLFRAVDRGNSEWGVPPYNGGLFSEDAGVSRVGGLLASITLPNTVVGPALRDLLLVESAEGLGPVDFRSLGVREFGTVYEGLLESELSIAEIDLSTDARGVFRPARRGEDPLVRKGEIYLHNASGARKASGSYFTKHFAVEHLLERSLEPALRDHLARLDGLDDDKAADQFFDFRVADIAMGSGHFLVAAVDHIERSLTEYLSRRRLPGVARELATLRAAALEALGSLSEQVEIEDTQLLRRMIARRCIYGVDLNPTAVALARLGVWIHTFVPGLPLSLLDHSLVCGNALVGIATIAEVRAFLEQQNVVKSGKDERTLAMFPIDAAHLLGAASEPLRRLARLVDATPADLSRARSANADALKAIAPERALFDLISACRIEGRALPLDFSDWGKKRDHIVGSKAHNEALAGLADLNQLHFPAAFPEVFLRSRAGFDVIIGNPPWEKVRFEAQQYWVTRVPGLNALPANDRPAAIEELRRNRPVDALHEQREIASRERLQRMVNAAFDLQGRGLHGHHDAAKLFAERALSICASEGRIGYVLPRTALVLGGWADLRKAYLSGACLTTLQGRNRGGWLFEDVDQRLMIILLSRAGESREPAGAGVSIWPAITSADELLRCSDENALWLAEDEIRALTDSDVIPWFSSRNDKPLFDRMRSFSRLGSGEGWTQASADSSRWDFSRSGPHNRFTSESDSESCWKVLMTRHVDAFRINEEDPFRRFVPEPDQLVALNLGVVKRRGRVLVGSGHPSLVYRYPSRNDDSRTLIAAALPEHGFLYSKGYVHGLRLNEASADVLMALLGYLNSFIADWWVRRFTDRHVTLPVLSQLPLPNWDGSAQQSVAAAASALTVRGGVESIAGGFEVSERPDLSDLADLELRARIEALVVRGFGLTLNLWRSAMEDFSNDACPSEFLKELERALARSKK